MGLCRSTSTAKTDVDRARCIISWVVQLIVSTPCDISSCPGDVGNGEYPEPWPRKHKQSNPLQRLDWTDAVKQTSFARREVHKFTFPTFGVSGQACRKVRTSGLEFRVRSDFRLWADLGQLPLSHNSATSAVTSISQLCNSGPVHVTSGTVQPNDIIWFRHSVRVLLLTLATRKGGSY